MGLYIKWGATAPHKENIEGIQNFLGAFNS